MGILTDDMRRVLDEQQLGFIATVAPEGKPNLSPKGTTAAWDDDHLVFADICSPNTVLNLRSNPAIEINVVDPIVRKGCRERGSANPVRSIVLVKVEQAAALISPAYGLGRTEEEVSAHWERRRDDLRRRRAQDSEG